MYKKGMTLIETLVYIAILVMVLVIVVNSFFVMKKSYSFIKINRDLNDSAISIIERLSREVRWSEDINAIGSVLDNNLSILSLTSISDEGLVEEVKFYVDANDLKIEGIGILNTENVSVDRFYLSLIEGSVSKILKIELTLSSQFKDKMKTRTFYDSIVLRGSY